MQISGSTFPPIFEGVNFLLSHLSKPEFPRTIATKLTEGRQVVVTTKVEALAYYKESNYMDCRLAAYPHNATKMPQVIDFVMLDLDLNNFKFSRRKLDKALQKILSILNKDNIQPTVIWSGNGYHVLVPLEPMESIFESMPEFTKFIDPSKYILRYLEKHLSCGKSDSVHNSTVSFGNCMLRVPNSFNSKYNNSNEVKIIKKWNGQRFNIKSLLGDFIAHLLDVEEAKNNNKYSYYNINSNLLSKP